MEKKQYVAPRVRCKYVLEADLLAGSERTLPYDPTDDTDEALSKESGWGNVWEQE